MNDIRERDSGDLPHYTSKFRQRVTQAQDMSEIDKRMWTL